MTTEYDKNVLAAIKRFESAVREHEVRGMFHPDERAEIEDEYIKAGYALLSAIYPERSQQSLCPDEGCPHYGKPHVCIDCVDGSDNG